MTFELDVASSMLRLDGHWIPAVGLVCPEVANDPIPADRAMRLLGGNDLQGGWYVPCESGLLVEVHWEETPRSGLHVGLYARSCNLHDTNPDRLWLPWMINLTGKTLRKGDWGRNVWGSNWYGCDPEWAYELLRRVERYEFHQPEGPEVEIVNVAETLELLNDLVKRGIDSEARPVV